PGYNTQTAFLPSAADPEYYSDHTPARAIREAAAARQLHVPPATDFTASTAVGVRAIGEGHTVAIGGPSLLTEAGHEALHATGEWSTRGATVLHVLIDDEIAGALALADEIRPESRESVDALHE